MRFVCHILAFKSRIRSFGSTGVQFCTLLVVCCSLPWRLSTRHSDMWQNYKTKPFRDEFIIRGRNRAKRSVCTAVQVLSFDLLWSDLDDQSYIHTYELVFKAKSLNTNHSTILCIAKKNWKWKWINYIFRCLFT